MLCVISNLTRCFQEAFYTSSKLVVETQQSIDIIMGITSITMPFLTRFAEIDSRIDDK